MGGFKAQDFEGLLQELEAEYGADESFPPQVDDLLRDLQADSIGTRLEAAQQLGDVSVSSPRIVDALIAAQQSDSDSTVRWYVADALRAPVHQRVLEQQPGLMERAHALTMETAAAQRARQESEQRAKQRASQAQGDSSPWPVFSRKGDVGILGLLLGVAVEIGAAIWQKASQGQRLGVVYGALGFVVGSYAAMAIWNSLLDVTCFLAPAAVALALGPLVGLLAGWGMGDLVRRKHPEQELLGRAGGALLGAFVAGFVVWAVVASILPPPSGR